MTLAPPQGAAAGSLAFSLLVHLLSQMPAKTAKTSGALPEAFIGKSTRALVMTAARLQLRFLRDRGQRVFATCNRVLAGQVTEKKRPWAMDTASQSSTSTR